MSTPVFSDVPDAAPVSKQTLRAICILLGKDPEVQDRDGMLKLIAAVIRAERGTSSREDAWQAYRKRMRGEIKQRHPTMAAKEVEQEIASQWRKHKEAEAKLAKAIVPVDAVDAPVGQAPTSLSPVGEALDASATPPPSPPSPPSPPPPPPASPASPTALAVGVADYPKAISITIDSDSDSEEDDETDDSLKKRIADAKAMKKRIADAKMEKRIADAKAKLAVAGRKRKPKEGQRRPAAKITKKVRDDAAQEEANDTMWV